jgi:ABC-2 type transport system permease protein
LHLFPLERHLDQVVQIVTLFNPLTYASEGLRYSMVPPVQAFGRSVQIPTLDTRWVLLALGGTIAVFFILGMRTFRNRVVS